MDGAVVALLVAGIPAAVAAATFAVGETLKIRASKDERIESAVAELAGALGAMAAIEDLPWRPSDGECSRRHWLKVAIESSCASLAAHAQARRNIKDGRLELTARRSPHHFIET